MSESKPSQSKHSQIIEPSQSKVKQPKQRQTESLVDKIITVFPQDTFISNCIYDFEVGKNRILAWNLVGIVALRHEF